MAGGARADADPEAEALKAQGNEKLKAGDVKGALALYQQALTRLPEKVATDSPAANLGSSLALNAALAALQLEDWEAAEGFCSRALRWKSSAKAFYRRGLARVHLGFMADAKRDFNFALESEPRGSAAARQVQLELDKLAHRDGAAGLEAPPGADPQAAKRFEIANAAKQQQGVRQITWSEWSSTQQRVAEATVKAKAWRKRLAEAAKCPVPESGGSTQLSQLLEVLAKKPAVKRPLAGELMPAEQAEAPASVKMDDAGVFRGSEGAGLQMLAPGPWLFEGRNSFDLPYEPLANPSGAFTVEVWAACATSFGHQCVLASRDDQAGYIFYVEPEGIWSFWVGTGKSWEKLYGTQVELGRWTHLRGTFDPQKREANFYVDRCLVNSRGWVDFKPNLTQPLRLGGGKEAQKDGGPRFFFTGDMRDVCILGRAVADEDITELAKAASQERADGAALEQLPKILREGKGRGLSSAQCALSCALKWAAGMAQLPSCGFIREDFRRASRRLLESSLTAQGVSVMFLSFHMGAAMVAGSDEVRLNFGSPGQHYWAVVLQSGTSYKILLEAEGLCSLPDTLARQQSLRPQTGWLTRKDMVMWLSALDTLVYGLDAEDIEDALLTVFLFGFWATKTLSPQVSLKGFDAERRCGKLQAALVPDAPPEAVEALLRSLTDEATK